MCFLSLSLPLSLSLYFFFLRLCARRPSLSVLSTKWPYQMCTVLSHSHQLRICCSRKSRVCVNVVSSAGYGHQHQLLWPSNTYVYISILPQQTMRYSVQCTALACRFIYFRSEYSVANRSLWSIKLYKIRRFLYTYMSIHMPSYCHIYFNQRRLAVELQKLGKCNASRLVVLVLASTAEQKTKN